MELRNTKEKYSFGSRLKRRNLIILILKSGQGKSEHVLPHPCVPRVTPTGCRLYSDFRSISSLYVGSQFVVGVHGEKWNIGRIWGQEGELHSHHQSPFFSSPKGGWRIWSPYKHHKPDYNDFNFNKKIFQAVRLFSCLYFWIINDQGTGGLTNGHKKPGNMVMNL
jgi:hypothetical protein